MRKIVIIVGTTVAIASAVYLLIMQKNVSPKYHNAEVGEAESTTKMDRKAPLSTNRGAPGRLDEDVNRELRNMEFRIRALETMLEKGEVENNEASRETKSSKSKTKTFSEQDLAGWMDQTLAAESSNSEIIKESRKQIDKSLAKHLPGVDLEDIKCGSRFCRATFAQSDGEQPDLQALFGQPPFKPPLTYEFFTISYPDNRVAIYYTNQSDKAMEGFKKEAVASAAIP